MMLYHMTNAMIVNSWDSWS